MTVPEYAVPAVRGADYQRNRRFEILVGRRQRSSCWIAGILARRDKLEFMPAISAFFGIVIRMFYREHEPPHFHAEYQGQQGKFSFDGKITAGNITSRTARRLIRQWASLHRRELDANWENMRRGRILERIAPLE